MSVKKEVGVSYHGCGDIYDMTYGREVSKRTHGVSIARSHIGQGSWGQYRGISYLICSSLYSIVYGT